MPRTDEEILELIENSNNRRDRVLLMILKVLENIDRHLIWGPNSAPEDVNGDKNVRK